MRNTNSPADLPFVGRTKSKASLSFWAVPPAKDYLEGTTVGIAMAAAYTTYLTGASEMPPILPQIVMDMMNAGALPDGLHGQIVGFLSAVEQRLVEETTNKRG